jgi:hypothetical protein
MQTISNVVECKRIVPGSSGIHVITSKYNVLKQLACEIFLVC